MTSLQKSRIHLSYSGAALPRASVQPSRARARVLTQFASDCLRLPGFQGELRKFKKPLTQYFLENFYVTTSGFFRTQALNATISEIGEDRVLFSVDYPYESMLEAVAWFDNAAINDNTREKIGRTNAERLFGLKR